MSIRKFISIKNVGRLVNCTHKGPELNRCTLVFAENGRGKTTLCAVLRSLQSGEPEHIIERQTIAPVALKPSASVRIEGGTANYNAKGWSTTVPEIAIFDASFVARNVHAGEHVSRDHRANLLQIIIGENGVALAVGVNELDEAIRDKNGEITRARRALQPHLPAGVKLEDFLGLEQDPDIEAKIAAKTELLQSANRVEEIKTRQLLSEIPIPVMPDELPGLLTKTLEGVSADAEQRLKEQIARHEMHEHGEAWIAEGLDHIRGDACPFCGQDLKDLPLIKAYTQYFSEAYDAFVSELDKLRETIEAGFGDAALAGLGKSLATNDAGVEFWRAFTEIKVDPPDFDGAFHPAALKFREKALRLMDAKQAAPLKPVTPDEDYEAAKTAYENAGDALRAYNNAVVKANAAIAATKESAESADRAALERELKGLNLIKLRYDEKVTPLCDDCIALADEKKKLDESKDAAKKALDDHADKMIRDYENTINDFLKGFGAGFTITNSKKTYIGGTPTSTYQILINNYAVDLGDASTPVGEACFRTTLSAGDKSTLALAFFLAQIDHDPKKAERIVVFDDPFNSQDRSRRERTAELLKKYGQECAQLILLSHDPFFLSLVYSKLPKVERHTIQLSRAPDNTTTIEEWDVEKETQEGYFKDHAALSSYLLNGAKNLIDIARKIRPVLEGYLRYRFPHQFPDNEWLGDMIKRIRETGAAHPMHPALEELADINDYSKKYHHDTNPGKADSEPINDGELQGYVERSLRIVGGY